MAGEVLGVESPEEKPAGYTSQSGFIEEFNVERAKIAEEREESRRARAEGRRSKGERMEADEAVAAE